MFDSKLKFKLEAKWWQIRQLGTISKFKRKQKDSK